MRSSPAPLISRCFRCVSLRLLLANAQMTVEVPVCLCVWLSSIVCYAYASIEMMNSCTFRIVDCRCLPACLPSCNPALWSHENIDMYAYFWICEYVNDCSRDRVMWNAFAFSAKTLYFQPKYGLNTGLITT